MKKGTLHISNFFTYIYQLISADNGQDNMQTENPADETHLRGHFNPQFID